MNPPPPIPATYGSVTPSTAAAATAASTALPPSLRIAIAARDASVSTLAAAPPVPIATACLLGVGAATARATNAQRNDVSAAATKTSVALRRRVPVMLGSFLLRRTDRPGVVVTRAAEPTRP